MSLVKQWFSTVRANSGVFLNASIALDATALAASLSFSNSSCLWSAASIFLMVASFSLASVVTLFFALWASSSDSFSASLDSTSSLDNLDTFFIANWAFEMDPLLRSHSLDKYSLRRLFSFSWPAVYLDLESSSSGRSTYGRSWRTKPQPPYLRQRPAKRKTHKVVEKCILNFFLTRTKKDLTVAKVVTWRILRAAAP